jgi:heat shock protein HtpX
MKNIKTFLLLFSLTVFLMFIGGLIGGRGGMTVALGFSLIINFISYWYSDKIVLKMYNAREVGENNDLYKIVSRVALKADLPMPKVYIINQGQPNAFATGRNPKNAAVACTTGLLNILDENEIAGVIGHELAHVNNRDILIGTVAASIAGAITWLASMARWAAIFGSSDDEDGGSPIALILTSILAPIGAAIIQMAISRTREYKADELGAKYCGNPLYLANALAKLDRGVHINPMNASEATSHMFIVSPLNGKKMVNLFSTHPDINDRIARLRKMVENY